MHREVKYLAQVSQWMSDSAGIHVLPLQSQPHLFLHPLPPQLEMWVTASQELVLPPLHPFSDPVAQPQL